MFKNVLLKKLIYISVLLITSLLALQYFPAELILIIMLIVFILLSRYLSGNATLDNEQGSNAESYELDKHQQTLTSTKALATMSINSLQNNSDDLVALIGIQDSASTTLTDAVMLIEELLSQQHSFIDSLMSSAQQGDDMQTTTKAINDLQGLASELEAAVHDAMRGLQFGDISVQSLQFTIDDIGLLSQALQQLQPIEIENPSADIERVMQEYLKKRSERLHNPVSSSNMESGDVELF